jgi:NADPH:quinone reductase-like Zn-dependent oxidoreductase
LVNGASGGVGSYAIQLLAACGATVLATGTSDDTDRLRGLGATTVIDYTAGPVADQVHAAYPDGVDALINLAGFTPADVPAAAVRQGGKVATTTAAPAEETLAAADLTSSFIVAGPVREVVAPLAEQAAAGDLKVNIAAVLPLEQATDGLGTLASGRPRGRSSSPSTTERTTSARGGAQLGS